MTFFSKRNMLVGIVTLAIGILAFVGVAKAFFQSSTTVTGNITAFILNPEGKVDGAVLDSGDQAHFGPETGALVAGQTKVGETLTVTGHAGSSSSYGRELEAETLQLGGNTINVIHARPLPPHEKDQDRPMPPADRKGGRRAAPPVRDGARPNPESRPLEGEPTSEKGLTAQQETPPAPQETASVDGTVKIVLIGRRGEARGLILNSGEQIALPKEVANTGLALNQETTVRVEGEVSKSEFGRFIRPVRLTIGDQTFSFNR